MAFQTGAPLLDAIVLAVVSKELHGTYGYKITQEIRSVLEISESTLYPVLRRLQKNGYLKTYDKAIAGRNRRYYQVTDAGRVQLESYQIDWVEYSGQITTILMEEKNGSL